MNDLISSINIFYSFAQGIIQTIPVNISQYILCVKSFPFFHFPKSLMNSKCLKIKSFSHLCGITSMFNIFCYPKEFENMLNKCYYKQILFLCVSLTIPLLDLFYNNDSFRGMHCF